MVSTSSSEPRPSKPPTISLCTPVFNEELHIAVILNEWIETLKDFGLSENFEIVIADDCSTDKTAERIAEFSEDNKVRLLRSDKNHGPGHALRQALDEAHGDWVLVIDSDGQYDLGQFLKSIKNVNTFEIFADKTCFYVGVRSSKTASLGARFGSRALHFLEKRIISLPIPDYNCAIKLAPTFALKASNLRANRFNYSFEHLHVLVKSGLVCKPILTPSEERRTGKSKAKLLRDGIDRALFLTFLLFEKLLIERDSIG